MSEEARPDIEFQSILRARDRTGHVQIRWGPMHGQLTPDATRMHALALLETAEAAVHDAALFRFLLSTGLDESRAAAAVGGLRDHRGDSTREVWDPHTPTERTEST